MRYKTEAANWNEALPIGNGRLGAMVFGGATTEHLQLNEETLWSGCPTNWNNPEAKDHLSEVRALVLEHKDYAAADLVCQKMEGPYNQSYLPLGDLKIEFDQTSGEYRRSLNLDSAIAVVRCGAQTREAFASAADQVIAVRISSTAADGLNCRVTLTGVLRGETMAVKDTVLRRWGKAPAHVDPDYKSSTNPILWDDAPGRGMRFETRLDARLNGGSDSRGKRRPARLGRPRTGLAHRGRRPGFEDSTRCPTAPRTSCPIFARRHSSGLPARPSSCSSAITSPGTRSISDA